MLERFINFNLEQYYGAAALWHGETVIFVETFLYVLKNDTPLIINNGYTLYRSSTYTRNPLNFPVPAIQGPSAASLLN